MCIYEVLWTAFLCKNIYVINLFPEETLNFKEFYLRHEILKIVKKDKETFQSI